MGLLPDLYTFSDLLRLNQLLAMNKRPIQDSGQILGFTLLIGDINLCIYSAWINAELKVVLTLRLGLFFMHK